MEPLKNRYNKKFFDKFCNNFELIPGFSREKFQKEIFYKEWKTLELKDRMYHISKILKSHLPKEFDAACQIMIKLIKQLVKENDEKISFEYMFLPDYIEKNGIEHFDISFDTMEEVTKFTSCEFAVRPFLIMDEKRSLKRMMLWSKNKNAKVRRLASEGCRPMLPWAIALPKLKKDPSPILDILENLKNDSNELVRKSVANNLNDISKDNPKIAISLAQKWISHSLEQDKTVKHGMRTLLKLGVPEVLLIFGYTPAEKIETCDFKIKETQVQFGANLEFDFCLRNSQDSPSKLRIEYAIFFLRSNGNHNKKVFMISEKTLKPLESIRMNRKNPFRPISTRKYYSGEQFVALIINGEEKEKLPFNLVGV